MSQALVLELTRLCSEKLGASRNDVMTETRHSNGRGVQGKTALQLLVNGCWAVTWLAKAHSVPLQGLVIEEVRTTLDQKRGAHRVYVPGQLQQFFWGGGTSSTTTDTTVQER